MSPDESSGTSQPTRLTAFIKANRNEIVAAWEVTVRSLPLFTDFEAFYEYPKYTRRPPDKSNDANLRAYRGTKRALKSAGGETSDAGRGKAGRGA